MGVRLIPGDRRRWWGSGRWLGPVQVFGGVGEVLAEQIVIGFLGVLDRPQQFVSGGELAGTGGWLSHSRRSDRFEQSYRTVERGPCSTQFSQ